MENNKFLCVFFRGSFDAWEAYQFDWNFQGSLGPNGSDSLPCRRDTELPHERPVPWADVQKSFEKNCFFFLSEFQTLEEALLQSSISGLVHYIKHCCLIGLCVIPFFATKHQPKCFSTVVDLSNLSILMAGKSSNFAVYVWTNLDIKIFIMIVNVFNSTNVGSSSQVHTCMHMYIHACIHAYIYGSIPLHT